MSAPDRRCIVSDLRERLLARADGIARMAAIGRHASKAGLAVSYVGLNSELDAREAEYREAAAALDAKDAQITQIESEIDSIYERHAAACESGSSWREDFEAAKADLKAKEARIADLEMALVGVLDLAENEAELRRRNVTGRNMTGAKKLETIKLLARSALTPTSKARETEGEVRK